MKIAARAGRVFVGDIDHPERRGIFEQQTKQIALLEDVPAAVSVVTKTAVLRIANVEPPSITSHRKLKSRRPHIAGKFPDLNPPADRTICQRAINGAATIFGSRQALSSFSLLPF